MENFENWLIENVIALNTYLLFTHFVKLNYLKKKK